MVKTGTYVRKIRESGIILNQSRFRYRVHCALEYGGIFDKCRAEGVAPTPYFFEALDYGRRARHLQTLNLTGIGGPTVDKLQNEIPIYDTIERRYAGFSNVLEQLWYGSRAPKYKTNLQRGYVFKNRKPWKSLTSKLSSAYGPLWLYICLCHRITGSGASFEHDHGWRNSKIYEMAGRDTLSEMVQHLSNHVGPIFTSIGNQIPPFNKPTDGWETGGRQYIHDYAPDLALKTWNFLSRNRTMSIRDAVDWVLDQQSADGYKRYKFVLTAWVMDIAEYLPYLVDPGSDVYHGKNAEETMSICFDNPNGLRKQDFYDAGTRIIADCTNTNPMDVEDVFCDFVRWIENYVPKKGFDHVIEKGIFNSNSLVWHEGRQP